MGYGDNAFMFWTDGYVTDEAMGRIFTTAGNKSITSNEPMTISKEKSEPTFTITMPLEYNYFTPGMIKDVQFYPPATKMIFKDGTTTVSVAQEGDEYSPEVGMMVCVLKYIFGNKKYNNMFNEWIKYDKKRQADRLKNIEAEKERKAIKKHRAEKKQRQKEARAEKRKKETTEAILEAFKALNAQVTHTEENDG